MDINTMTLIASVFLPVLVDLVNRVLKVQSPNVAKVVASVLAFVVALASELSTKPAVDVPDLLSRFAVVFALSQVVYSNIYKDTKVNLMVRGQ